MNNFEFYTPTRVIFGKDTETRTGEMLKKYGVKKVLIHYGGGSVVRSGLLDRVKKSIDEVGIPYVELGGVVPNPRLSKVYEGIDICKKEGVDFILAVGGGSAIDSGKAIAMGAVYDGDVWDIFDRKYAPVDALRHGCVITLAATGSEMSNSTVITKDEGGIKRGFNTDFNRPTFAIMNPELLYTLPAYQTSCGVTDIMMHTFERYFSKGSLSAFTDQLAMAVIKTCIQYGPVCLEDPTNYNARAEIFWAGSLSHNNTVSLSRENDWGTHQLEHELSGMFDVAHGAGLAAVWGSWARYVIDENPMRFATYGRDVFGFTIDTDDPKASGLQAIRATERFFESINMPTNVHDLLGGHVLTDAEIEELAEKCTWFGRRTISNFKKLGKEDIIKIYNMAK